MGRRLRVPFQPMYATRGPFSVLPGLLEVCTDVLGQAIVQLKGMAFSKGKCDESTTDDY